MKLKHIYLEGCGRFLEPVTVAGLAPGLNVLAAPNEAGKSTLFRAVRACIFEKHTARGKDLRDLATQGANVPLTIEVGFEHGGHEYVARKTFLSSPRASLTRDGAEIAAARAADEEIYGVLGLKPGSGHGVDEGAFGMLWVAQSKSFAPPEVEGAVKNSIEDAIEREVGSLVGGDRARDLIKKVSDELGALYTPSGQVKKSGALGVAGEREEALARDLADTRDLLARLEGDIDDLERKRKARSELADPAEEAALRKALDTARHELQAARDAEREVNETAKSERLAFGALEKAEKTLTDLRTCAQRIDEATEKRLAISQTLAELDGSERECVAGTEAANAALDVLEKGDERDEQAQAHLRRLATLARSAAGLADLERRHAGLLQTTRDIAAVRGALGAIRATAKDVQAFEQANREIAVLRGRLEAAAPRVEITPAPDAHAQITIDGAAVSRQTSFHATRPARVAIAGVGEIAISPPAAFGEAEKAKLTQLEAARAKILGAADVADEAALRTEVNRRAELDSRLEALRAGLAALDCNEADLPARTTSLAESIAGVKAQMADLLGEDSAPDHAVIEAKQDALQRKRRETAEGRQRLNATLKGLGERLREIAAASAQARTQLVALDSQLQADLALLPPTARAAALSEAGEAFTKARRAHDIAKLTLDQVRERAPSPDHIEQLESRVRRGEQALDNHAKQLAAIGAEIGQLEGRIQSRGGEGLGEKAAALEEEHALAKREAERIRARAECLALLRQTVESCYEEQREQLQAPIRKRLQPFLNDLFPKAELTLDESFAIQRIVRAGSAESFDRLSDGTREQIAVLVRLAMGALLHERGEDLPIILDDALVFCDDDRIELMFDALNRAARTQQVIVLTCRGKSFRTLGGKALAIEPAARPR